MSLEAVSWILVAVLVYTYVGYGVVMASLVWLKSKLKSSTQPRVGVRIDCTLIIAAWNEAEILPARVKNLETLTYGRGNLDVLFVTDGSNDGSAEWLRQNTSYKVIHSSERRGKSAALNRAMEHVTTPAVAFTDANTILHPESIDRLMAPYSDPEVGAIAGEKRVGLVLEDSAHGAGEGMYWRYESTLKDWDSRLNTVVGAAGELFSVRTALYEQLPADTILDDFMVSLRVVEKGFRVAYVRDAWALEAPSLTLSDEMRRKTRICAGGFQAIFRLPGMLNVIKRPLAVFQYVSHRVFRWAVAPFLLPAVLVLAAFLAATSVFWFFLFLLQAIFYASAIYGWCKRDSGVPARFFYVPLYFT
ncbi:glycosyltransferase family 2 protein, partial [Rhodothermus sp. AH-315-K08]|nr:glycosyltransferase family 2 protein [Rhodothermus sp. AH-315-K08]